MEVPLTRLAFGVQYPRLRLIGPPRPGRELARWPASARHRPAGGGGITGKFVAGAGAQSHRNRPGSSISAVRRAAETRGVRLGLK